MPGSQALDFVIFQFGAFFSMHQRWVCLVFRRIKGKEIIAKFKKRQTENVNRPIWENANVKKVTISCKNSAKDLINQQILLTAREQAHEMKQRKFKESMNKVELMSFAQFDLTIDDSIFWLEIKWQNVLGARVHIYRHRCHQWRALCVEKQDARLWKSCFRVANNILVAVLQFFLIFIFLRSFFVVFVCLRQSSATTFAF